MQNRYVAYILKESVEISIVKTRRYYPHYQANISTMRPQIHAQIDKSGGGSSQKVEVLSSLASKYLYCNTSNPRSTNVLHFRRGHVHFLATGLERYCCMRLSRSSSTILY